MARSLAGGQPRAAIEASLALAARVAATRLDWPVLATIVELHRSVLTCFKEKLEDVSLYGQAFAATHGHERLAAQLLYDGKPTVDPVIGLEMCSVCEEGGVAAPWREYLTQFRPDRTSREGRSKADRCHYEGLLQVHGAEVLAQRTGIWLSKNDNIDSDYLKSVIHALGRSGGGAALQQVMSKASNDTQRALIELELARQYAADGKTEESIEYATMAAMHLETVPIEVEAINLGVSLEILQ